MRFRGSTSGTITSCENNATALTTNHIETAGAYHLLRINYNQLLDWLQNKRISARNE